MALASTPPPVPPTRAVRHPTQDFDLLAANVRQLSEDLAAERKARTEDKDKGLSVTKLHVPFVMVFAVVSLLTGAAGGAALFVHETSKHIANKDIHVNAGAAEARGGIAYTKDITDAFSEANAHSRAALRAIVKSSPITCTPLRPGEPGYGRGKSECKFSEPEIRQ